MYLLGTKPRKLETINFQAINVALNLFNVVRLFIQFIQLLLMTYMLINQTPDKRR